MAEAEVTPADLKFRFQVNKQLPATITIHNPTIGRIAFKVKTTTPKKYVVRPSSGVVDGGATSNVQVTMQAQKDFPPDFANCKDKFKVETAPLDAGEELTADTFRDSARVKDTKIRVVLEGPPAPPSPVPEVNETEDESAKSEKDNVSVGPVPVPLRHSDDAGLSTENKHLKSQVERLMGERDELRRKLITGGGAAKAASLPILPILLAAFLAFFIGHFLKPETLSALLGRS